MTKEKTTKSNVKQNDKNIHAQHRQRLQQQIFLSNPANMTEIQLLEYILTLSIPRIDTNPLAHKLLEEFGSLYAVLDADYSSLLKIKGIGKRTAMMLPSLRKIFYYYRESKREECKETLDTPSKIMEFFREFLESKPSEEIYVACMNGKNEIIKVEKMMSGDVNSISFSTRRLSEIVLKHNASMVAIGHNHPQGDPQPSFDDFNTTVKVVETLIIFNIAVVDHVIIGKDQCFSFAASGLLSTIKNELSKQQRPELASRIMNLIKN